MFKPEINSRVVIWNSFQDEFKGRTGTLAVHDVNDQLFIVVIDGWDDEIFAENEVYFPNHPLGYNQPCFR